MEPMKTSIIMYHEAEEGQLLTQLNEVSALDEMVRFNTIVDHVFAFFSIFVCMCEHTYTRTHSRTYTSTFIRAGTNACRRYTHIYGTYENIY